MRCKKCASLLKEGDTVCPVCGAAVSEEPASSGDTCSKCGAELKPGAKFCPKCGEKTAAAPAFPQPSADSVKSDSFISLSKEPETPEKTDSVRADVCPKCAAELKPGAKFCPKCGAKTEAAGAAPAPVPAPAAGGNACAKCGTELKPGAKFCPKCGAKTEAAASAPAPVPAPAAGGNVCPKCAAELRPGAKFCPKCGTKTEAAASAPTSAPTPAPAAAPVSGDTKVCPKCHGVMKPGTKVCAVCGYKLGDPLKPDLDATAPIPEGKDSFSSPAPAPTPAPAPAAPAVPKKPLSPLPFILIGIALVVIVGIIILVNVISGLLNKPQSIDLDKYVTVEFEGYTGSGTATVSFDEDSFSSDWKSKLSYKKEARQFKHAGEIESGDPTTLIAYYAKKSLKLDKSEELSNGDVVKAKWKISDTAKKDILEFLNCEVTGSNPEFTVEGLKEVEAVDLFAGISVTFEGTAPNGYAYVKTSSSDYYFSYSIDKESGLSNGDKVVVELKSPYSSYDSLESYMIEEYKKKPAALKKEYEVTGLKVRMAKLEQVSDSILTDVKSEVESFIDSDTSKTGVTLNSKEYLGLVLGAKTESGSYDFNRLYAVYKVTVSLKDDSSKKPVELTYYTAEYFEDLVLTSDGSLESSYLSGYHNYDTVRPSTKNYYSFYGYETYDKLYEAITKKTGYSYETNITAEASEPEEESKTEESSETSGEGSDVSKTESDASGDSSEKPESAPESGEPAEGSEEVSEVETSETE